MRAYRLLLRLYPASFRHEYGEELCAVFARRRREARTMVEIAALWRGAIGDACATAAMVHWDVLRQDLRYASRTLGRTPAFAATAVAIVSLGVGATTAAFSVMDFALIRPLPFPDPERLVKVYERRPGFPRMELSPANYRDFKRTANSFGRPATPAIRRS